MNLLAAGVLATALGAQGTDTIAGMRDCVRQARAVSARSSDAWPGWRLADFAIMVSNEHPPAVVLGGDGAPPREFARVAGDTALFERLGTVPDTLLGLHLATDWNGRRKALNIVQFSTQGCLTLLLHESFHGYQNAVRDSVRFHMSSSGAVPPERDPEAAAFLLTEGRFLAGALLAPNSAARRTAVLRAAAARYRRFFRVGADAYHREADVEQLEGSAEYAATVLVSALGPLDRRRAIADSARRHFGSPQLISMLGRPYFYWTGAAWIALAAAGGGAEWAQVAERDGIEGVVQRVLAGRIRDTAAVVRSRAFVAALDSARATTLALVRAEQRRADSASKAFWSQEGVPVRIRWTEVSGLNSFGHSALRGESEFTLRWPAPGNFLTVRGTLLQPCCQGSLVVMVPRDDLDIVVSGRRVPLDGTARRASGPMTVRGKGMAAEVTAGEVEVWRDSVAVYLGVRPQRPRRPH